jgi:hypothetical protein
MRRLTASLLLLLSSPLDAFTTKLLAATGAATTRETVTEVPEIALLDDASDDIARPDVMVHAIAGACLLLAALLRLL